MAHPDEFDRALGADNRLFLAHVVDNRDPDKRGRVKVAIPGRIDQTGWCEVCMPGQGHPRTGIFAPLPIDAICVVGFLLGDVEDPVVLGAITPPDPQGIAPRAGLSVEQTANVLTIAMGRYTIGISGNEDAPTLYIRDEGTPGTTNEAAADPCLVVFDGAQRSMTISSKTVVYINASAIIVDGMRVTLQGRPVLRTTQAL